MEQYNTTRHFLFTEVIGLYSLCKTHRSSSSSMSQKDVGDEMDKLEEIEEETCCSCDDKTCVKELDRQFENIRSKRNSFEEGYNKEFLGLIHQKRDHIINNVLPNTEFYYHIKPKINDTNKREAIRHLIDFIVCYFTCRQSHYSLGMDDYDIGFNLIESVVLY